MHLGVEWDGGGSIGGIGYGGVDFPVGDSMGC